MNIELTDKEINSVVLLMPFEEYALLSAVGEWEDVFSVNGKTGFIVNPIEFARDLSDELKRY
jgi:hypothetical protein